jgi:hypothetical protein
MITYCTVHWHIGRILGFSVQYKWQHENDLQYVDKLE